MERWAYYCELCADWVTADWVILYEKTSNEPRECLGCSEVKKGYWIENTTLNGHWCIDCLCYYQCDCCGSNLYPTYDQIIKLTNG